MVEQAAAPIANPDELKNCGTCKKPVKRAKRYYRNGKYYCTKNCWNKSKRKATEAKEA